VYILRIMDRKPPKKHKYRRHKSKDFDSYRAIDFYAARHVYSGETLKEFKQYLKKYLKHKGRRGWYVSHAVEMKKSIFKAFPYIKDAIESVGVTKVAHMVGVNRVSLYHMFSGHGNPSLINIENVLEAIGLKIVVEHEYDEED
jgi:DNA-binding phage protein